MLGQRIRAVRQQQGMTITELAEMVDLSPSSVSQIERDLQEPLLRTLRAICGALNIPLSSLFFDSSRRDIVIRKDERRSFSPPGYHLDYELLSPDSSRRLEVISMVIEPGRSSSEEPFPHGGDECLVVLEGDAEVVVAGRSYRLSAGDSIYVDEGLPHKVTNVGTDELRCIVSITPFAF